MKKRIVLFTAVLVSAAGHLYAQTTDEAVKLAHTIETEVAAGKSTTLDHFFDLDKLIENIFKNTKVPGDRESIDKFKSSFAANMSTSGRQTVKRVRGGSYKLLRAYQKDGRQHLLFRMLETHELNYYDYLLTRTRDSVKATDCFIYATDENMSITMAKGEDLIRESAKVPRGDMHPTMLAMMKLGELRNVEDYAFTKAYYDGFLERFKNNKMILKFYLSVCRKLSDSLYQEQVERYAKLFPSTSSSYLLMVDLYLLKKDYNKGLEAINKLDGLVGKDPFLDYYRYQLYKLAGQEKQSADAYERVYKYDSLLVRSLQER